MSTNDQQVKGIAASATAAWSSQIIAFWGAIFIAVQTTEVSRVTNAVTSMIALITARRRASLVSKLLRRNDWLLMSGWENGKTRMDVVIICWEDHTDLKRLALEVSMQIEAVARNWEVLICGRQLKGQSWRPSGAYWIQCPRTEAFSTTRVQVTNEFYFPLSSEDVTAAVAHLENGWSLDDIAAALCQQFDSRPSRCAFLNEVRSEIHQISSLPRHVTGYTLPNALVPFVSFHSLTTPGATSRTLVLTSAPLMYSLLHLTVSTAIGLMGAASGRGLSVWIMSVRPTLANLGTKNVAGDDSVISLLSFDKLHLQYETAIGSHLLANDALVFGLPTWHFVGALILPGLELAILFAGWLYGALRVEKLRPRGVVGHGMLWLAAVVGIALSMRTLVGIKKRRLGRLIGIRRSPEFVQYTIGSPTAIETESLMQETKDGYDELRLITRLLQECSDDTESFLATSGILRRPEIGTMIAEYVVTKIFKYQYNGDSIEAKGDSGTPVAAARVYPWVQAACCSLLTAACAVMSVVYAYLDIPKWIKPMTEGLLAISAVWFASLERISPLHHNRDSYTCHMVATMVISAVWYVGVKDVG
ncbi:MAG: hypothetical protein M1816_003635 [Peltula sp. TS41687]|nr:MAG: hypothetical protein M1816_003635 [Peltula sp. TS41687]